jgi:hypothetical protein
MKVSEELILTLLDLKSSSRRVCSREIGPKIEKYCPKNKSFNWSKAAIRLTSIKNKGIESQPRFQETRRKKRLKP